MRSRVIPGSLVTMERRVPVKRLKSVDLPTLGRPTITRDGSCAVMNLSGGAIIHCTVSRRDAPMKIEYGQQDRKVRTPHERRKWAERNHWEIKGPHGKNRRVGHPKSFQ